MPIKTYISTITLNENGLNAPTERFRLLIVWGFPYMLLVVFSLTAF